MMLILSRIPSQKIIIGDKADVRISVLSVSGEAVTLGLVLAKEVAVNRLEHYRRPAQKKWAVLLNIKIKALLRKILISTRTAKPNV